VKKASAPLSLLEIRSRSIYQTLYKPVARYNSRTCILWNKWFILSAKHNACRSLRLKTLHCLLTDIRRAAPRPLLGLPRQLVDGLYIQTRSSSGTCNKTQIPCWLTRFQVLTATSTKMTVSWDVATCSLVYIDRASVNLYHTTRGNIPEDNLHTVFIDWLIPCWFNNAFVLHTLCRFEWRDNLYEFEWAWKDVRKRIYNVIAWKLPGRTE
jgi:hypothetical protein